MFIYLFAIDIYRLEPGFFRLHTEQEPYNIDAPDGKFTYCYDGYERYCCKYYELGQYGHIPSCNEEGHELDNDLMEYVKCNNSW